MFCEEYDRIKTEINGGYMSIRQKVLFEIKSIELAKAKAPKKVSSYFGVNTFGLENMRKHISPKTFSAFKEIGRAHV